MTEKERIRMAKFIANTSENGIGGFERAVISFVILFGAGMLLLGLVSALGLK